MPDGVRSQRGAGRLKHTGARPSTAVVGVADHSGWAVCVTVAASRGLPVVVDRRRIELIEPDVPTQPYHHETVGMRLAEAEKDITAGRISGPFTTAEEVAQHLNAARP